MQYRKSQFQRKRENQQNDAIEYMRYVINNYETSKRIYYQNWAEELKKEGNEKIKSVIDHKYQSLIADAQKYIDEWNKKIENYRI